MAKQKKQVLTHPPHKQDYQFHFGINLLIPMNHQMTHQRDFQMPSVPHQQIHLLNQAHMQNRLPFHPSLHGLHRKFHQFSYIQVVGIDLLVM